MVKKMMNRKKFIEKFEEGFDFIFNDTVTSVGGFLVNLFTATVCLWSAVFGTIPVIPQWAWAGMFVFMLAVGAISMENMLYADVDEDDYEEEDEEDDEEE